jgi:hypothetical protein
MPNDHNRLGRMAEFMVCAEITRLGFHAIHADAPGFDILLIHSKRPYRVQVKSSTLIKEERFCEWRCRIHISSARGAAARARGLTHDDCDLLALYQHQLSKVVFRPVIGREKVKISLTTLREMSTFDSLTQAIAQLKG